MNRFSLLEFSDRIFKFSTLNKKTTQRSKRVFLIFFCLYSLTLILWICYQSIELINFYKLLEKVKILEKTSYQVTQDYLKELKHMQETNSTQFFSSFNAAAWREVGIEDPYPEDTRLAAIAYKIQENNISYSYFLIFLLIILLFLPWILSRLTLFFYNYLYLADNSIKL